MLRHDMWRGEVPEGMTVPEEIVEMKPGPLTEAYSQKNEQEEVAENQEEKDEEKEKNYNIFNLHKQYIYMRNQTGEKWKTKLKLKQVQE